MAKTARRTQTPRLSDQDARPRAKPKAKSKAALPKAPLYLTEADVRRLVTVKDAIATLELLFETWPDPATVNLPRQRAPIGNGAFNLMGAAWGAPNCSG